MRFAHLKSRIFNTPLLIHPDKLTAIYNVVAPRWGEDGRLEVEAQVTALNERRPERRLYQLTEGGVAVIPVLGTLVQRVSGVDAMSGLMSYGLIGARLNQALEDPEARAILLEVDSPGGEVAGCFALAEQIFQAREQKPVWAVANEMAFSAGYALACAAERVFLPETAELGSIGVIAWHIDQSEMDAKRGLTWTAIFAGRHKADFNPHEPLSDAARARAQAEVDELYNIFARAVARNRGLSEEEVKATEALTYLGRAAVEAGLADAVAPFAEVAARLAERAGERGIPGGYAAADNHHKEGIMPDKPTEQAAAQTAEAVPGADLEAARAEAAKAAQERIAAILGLEEAQGRDKLARHLAFHTVLSPEEARAALAAAPAEKAGPEPGTEFKAAMEQAADPGVGPDAERPAADESRPGSTAANMERLLKQRGLRRE